MPRDQTAFDIEFDYVNKIVRLPPATDEQIGALEAQFGGATPEDYRRFLQTINGGMPSRSFLERSDESFEIECLYGLGSPTKAYSVEWQSGRVSSTLGHAVMAIAGNGASDQLIYSSPVHPAI